MAGICYPKPRELITFPILKKKSVSNLNNNYSSKRLNLLFKFHEETFRKLFQGLESLNFLAIPNDDPSVVFEPAYLRILLKSVRFVDRLNQKMALANLPSKLKKLPPAVEKYSTHDQLVIFLLFSDLIRYKVKKLFVDLDTIFKILDNNVESGKEPLLTSAILLYLTSLMDDSKFISKCFEHKFKTNNMKKGQGSKLPFYNRLFAVLRKFLKLSDFDSMKFLRPEVCSFGFANFGAFDGAIKILLANLVFSSKKKELFFDYLKGFTFHGVKDVMFYLFEKMKSEFVLSLKGLVYLFSLIVELITNTKEHLLIIEALLKESRVKVILSFLNEDLFGASKNWPKKLGGDGVFDECLCNHVLKLLELLISGILRNNNKTYMKSLANQLKTFPNLMKSILNVYLQSMGYKNNVVFSKSTINQNMLSIQTNLLAKKATVRPNIT